MSTTDTAVYDRESLLERIGDDEELLVEIIGIFRDECTRMVDEVRDAVTAADAGRVERSAHSLKGALLNISANQAAERALELEAVGREGRLEASVDLLARLEAEIAVLQDALA